VLQILAVFSGKIQFMKTTISLPLFATFLTFIFSASAQKSPTLADLLRDKGCSIVMDVERDQWRDANINDYQTSGWKAWMAQTKSKTPWRAVGDFDGDGMEDVAKVVIRQADNAWMLGVEFGYKNKADCRRQQIASNSGKPAARLVGLLPLARGTKSLTCHHISESQPATCTLPAAGLLENRKTDAFLMTDDIPTRTDGFVWAPFRDIKKSDGSPMMAFESELISVGIDMASAIAAVTKDQGKPQANDKVSPAERTALLAQFDAAFNNAEKRSHRIRTESAMSLDGKDFKSKSITDFAPPNKMLMTLLDEDGSESVTLLVGKQAWERKGAAAWQFAGSDVPITTGMGAAVGNRGIVAVRSEMIKGRKVKTIEVSDPPADHPMVAILSIDETTQLPVQRIDRMDSLKTVTTSIYDFDTKITFPATPAAK
jgi:hypothetical protein